MKPVWMMVLMVCACSHEKSQPVLERVVDEKPAQERKNALRGLLIPPAEVGQFTAQVEGCAAEPQRQVPVSRAPPVEEKVIASAVGTGIVLTHQVPHACCLSAATQVEITGERVVVTDLLSGEACRCRCSSSLRTAVRLKPGSYALEVRTSVEGRTYTAWAETVQVR